MKRKKNNWNWRIARVLHSSIRCSSSISLFFFCFSIFILDISIFIIILFSFVLFCRYRNRWHIRDVGRMASNIGQIGRTRTYGSDVIGGSRVNHHYVLDRYDFAGDWHHESIPIDTNILQIQWIGRMFHLCVASDILCRLHGRVRLLREKEFTFDIRLQSFADVGGHSRYVSGCRWILY